MGAAAVLGGSLVLACLVLVVGLWLAADRLARRLDGPIRAHGSAVSDAGGRVGTAVDQLMLATNRHADAVRQAGAAIARPEITVAQPVPIREPVKIRGPADDGALPVNAKIGK